MDIGRRQKTLGSKTKDAVTQGTVGSMSSGMFAPVPKLQLPLGNVIIRPKWALHIE